MAKTVYSNDKVAAVLPMTYWQLGRVAIAGGGIGLLAWALGHFLDVYVYRSIMCHQACSLSSQYGNATAIVITAALGLFALVRLQVFRPLLAILASTITLWGVLDIVYAMAWYWAALMAVLLFAISYALFTWIARIRRFLPTVIVMVILIIVIRFFLTS